MELEHLMNTLALTLKSNQLKLVTAESCTGGGLSYYLTSVSGSSDWFERGFVTYSNEAKMELLQVPSSTLEKFGAVSEETAIAMAEGALKNSHADISIAITGIAGPDGGSKNKPVGTIWLGMGQKNQLSHTQKLQLKGTRESIREQTIATALEWLIALAKPTSTGYK